MNKREYHMHQTTGEVVMGPASRCIDPDVNPVDVTVMPVATMNGCKDLDCVDCAGCKLWPCGCDHRKAEAS